MKALQNFVAQKNHWNSFFKGTQYNLNTAKDRQALANMIDSALSPENLTCDGELPRSQVQARYRELTAVAKELKQLDPAVKFYEFA